MNDYKEKIEQLRSLIEEIKKYGNKEIEKKVEIAENEKLLNSQAFADIDLEQVSGAPMAIFNQFLDGYIEVYTETLLYLREKEKHSRDVCKN